MYQEWLKDYERITKEKGCEYCRERGRRENLLDDDKLTLKIKKDRVLGFSIRAEIEEHIIYTNINYCPMCGRKLKEGD